MHVVKNKMAEKTFCQSLCPRAMSRGNGMMFSKTEEGRMDCIIIWPAAAAAVEERESDTAAVGV